ncbi:menaquinol-cytochrome C reductase iron-sulfur subunit [Paenibacillus marchantiophytorum]|uniref:Menaquinol-cytochrome C reductase iron-sulfur subunit n=1 Tax=Paenibacillus marchantiophytorum TaxID=1619310 RepID=A0ABQ1FG85_9BACL|nr:Rieske (2Fe-2S) protein [Paenibacillus marchantiophytorum]GGA10338.1 menaquinol-cytochrome C reductase iron-sulfur subunit [Paenibacillus marchantiophytorum]
MTERLPQKISRRSFLTTSGKLTVGVIGVLAGNTGLFYYGAMHQKKPITEERPGNWVELGELEQLSKMKGLDKIPYEAIIQAAWVKKEVSGSVYVTRDENGNLLILSPECTHLGCSIDPVINLQVNQTKEGYYRCPCHGAEFDAHGNSVGGAVLQGLDTYRPIIENGKVYIDISAPMKGKMQRV